MSSRHGKALLAGWEERRSRQRLSRRQAAVWASGGCQASVNCIKAKDKHITASLVTAEEHNELLITGEGVIHL